MTTNIEGFLDWLSAGVGTAGGIFGALKASQEAKKREQYLQDMRRQLQRPPREITQDIYEPLTDAAHKAMVRALKAEMASAGRPMEGGYADSIIAELMAKTESERWLEALRSSGTLRGQQLQGMQGVYSAYQPIPWLNMLKGFSSVPNLLLRNRARQENVPKITDFGEEDLSLTHLFGQDEDEDLSSYNTGSVFDV